MRIDFYRRRAVSITNPVGISFFPSIEVPLVHRNVTTPSRRKGLLAPWRRKGGRDTVFDILVALVQLQYFLVRGTDTKKIHNFITTLIV